MISVTSINAAAEVAYAHEQYAKAEEENAFATELISKAIAGKGDSIVARHKLQTARIKMGLLTQKEEFWGELVKQELNGYKKSWEMIKS